MRLLITGGFGYLGGRLAQFLACQSGDEILLGSRQQAEPPRWLLEAKTVQTQWDSLTGGRVKRMQSFTGNETCMLTYGDGVADIDVGALVVFHKIHGKMVTVTAVRPGSRFGELQMDGDSVTAFQEKPQLGQGWINGGYFVIEPAFFELIESDATMLERGPLERAASMGQFKAYRHEGFWHCMDTKRDHELLETLWAKGNAPWKTRGVAA